MAANHTRLYDKVQAILDAYSNAIDSAPGLPEEMPEATLTITPIVGEPIIITVVDWTGLYALCQSLIMGHVALSVDLDGPDNDGWIANIEMAFVWQEPLATEEVV